LFSKSTGRPISMARRASRSPSGQWLQTCNELAKGRTVSLERAANRQFQLVGVIDHLRTMHSGAPSTRIQVGEESFEQSPIPTGRLRLGCSQSTRVSSHFICEWSGRLNILSRNLGPTVFANQATMCAYRR
jgi:hypothetical protein